MRWHAQSNRFREQKRLYSRAYTHINAVWLQKHANRGGEHCVAFPPRPPLNPITINAHQFPRISNWMRGGMRLWIRLYLGGGASWVGAEARPLRAQTLLFCSIVLVLARPLYKKKTPPTTAHLPRNHHPKNERRTLRIYMQFIASINVRSNRCAQAPSCV